MKKIERKMGWGLTFRCMRTLAVIGLAMFVHTSARAIPNLKIAVQGADVVLTWPSQPGAEYIVEYRLTLLPENPWARLAGNHPASAGQFTTFTHAGVFTCPPLAGGGGSGGGGPPPAPGAAQGMAAGTDAIPLW